MSLNVEFHQKGDFNQNRWSLTLKYNTKLNISQNEMLVKIIVTRIGMSLQLEYHSNWIFTQIGMECTPGLLTRQSSSVYNRPTTD